MSALILELSSLVNNQQRHSQKHSPHLLHGLEGTHLGAKRARPELCARRRNTFSSRIHSRFLYLLRFQKAHVSSRCSRYHSFQSHDSR